MDDFERVKKYNWHVAYRERIDDYYAQHTMYLGKIDGKPKYKMIYMHRFIMDEEGKIDVDHVHHRPLDNRRSNLEIKNRSENLKNRLKENKNNKCGYRNVCFVEGRYIVQLQINRKNTRLGSFKDVHEAGKFAEEMRIKYYGKK